MEKDIGKINKNDTTDIVIRIDDFGGRKGLTVREFVTSERYTGFTKAGIRIPAAEFLNFREMINSILLDDIQGEAESEAKSSSSAKPKAQKTISKKESTPEEGMDY